MTAWPDDAALTQGDLEAARHEGREDREASDLLSAALDDWWLDFRGVLPWRTLFVESEHVSRATGDVAAAPMEEK